MEKPFQGLATFLKSPVNDFSREIGVIGLPFDGATSYRPGARFAPNAIRQASMMLTDGGHPMFSRDPLGRVTDLGDIAVSNLNVAKSLDQITTAFETHPFLSDPSKRILSMGGDHTVTTGILRALARQHPNLIVVHVDAHCDTWSDHFGDPLGHGTWVRNVVEEGLVKAENIFQIGIRSPVDLDTQRWLTDRGGTVWTTREALKLDGTQIARSVFLKVWEKAYERGEDTTGIYDRPVYLSFDIDALDPAYAPGTGTPEMGGLTSIFALELVESLAFRLIGADLVEVNPSYDPTGITALAGATLLWTIAAGMAP